MLLDILIKYFSDFMNDGEFINYYNFTTNKDSEFSSHKIKLRKMTLFLVTNSKTFTEIILSSY